jgi:hypothetical protein
MLKEANEAKQAACKVTDAVYKQAQLDAKAETVAAVQR